MDHLSFLIPVYIIRWMADHSSLRFHQGTGDQTTSNEALGDHQTCFSYERGRSGEVNSSFCGAAPPWHLVFYPTNELTLDDKSSIKSREYGGLLQLVTSNQRMGE